MANPNPLLASIDEGVALADPHVTVHFARDGEREKMTGPFRFLRKDGALEVLAPAEGG